MSDVKLIGTSDADGTWNPNLVGIGSLRIATAFSRRFPNVEVMASEDKYGRLFTTISLGGVKGWARVITNRSATVVYEVMFVHGANSINSATTFELLADMMNGSKP